MPSSSSEMSGGALSLAVPIRLDGVRDIHDPDLLLEGSNWFVGAEAAPVAYPAVDADDPRNDNPHLPPDVVEGAGRRADNPDRALIKIS